MRAIHTAVSGRARLRVAGLRGNSSLKRRIEELLPDGAEIRGATASTVTGNALIVFDRRLPLSDVIERLERVVRGPASKSGRQNAGPNWHSLPAGEVLQLLDSGPEGLTSEEAQRRSQKYGANLLPRIARR